MRYFIADFTANVNGMGGAICPYWVTGYRLSFDDNAIEEFSESASRYAKIWLFPSRERAEFIADLINKFEVSKGRKGNYSTSSYSEPDNEVEKYLK